MLFTLPMFGMYFGSSLLMLIAALFVYIKITPYNELTLIRAGNTSASVSLSGTILGMVIPMASVIAHSVSFLDMLMWCAISLVVQLLIWELVNWIFGNLQKKISVDNCTASAIMLAVTSVAVGVLQAACVVW
jgi:putative membrane protein